MPRPNRLNIAGLPQHVTQRGNNRQDCFIDTLDYDQYLALLGNACRKHSCEIHAFVLMTNHVHILMTPNTPDGASLVFRDLGRDYVRQFNKRHKRTGTLWEGRFKSSLVEEDNYLLACYRYIELNPVRARMVEDPSEYQWSSFRVNALGMSNDLLKPHESWLMLGSDNQTRQMAYLSLFDSVLGPEQIEAIRFGITKGLPTGSETFKQRVENTLSIKLSNGRRGRPQKVV